MEYQILLIRPWGTAIPHDFQSFGGRKFRLETFDQSLLSMAERGPLARVSTHSIPKLE
jgi:hypothetical protein